jgi:sec-independent protein translocase protein TatA
MLGRLGWPELLIVLMIALLLFGGRLTKVAGDLAKGIKIFRRNLQDEEKPDQSDDVENDLPKP